jgi:hypothetical protein
MAGRHQNRVGDESEADGRYDRGEISDMDYDSHGSTDVESFNRMMDRAEKDAMSRRGRRGPYMDIFGHTGQLKRAREVSDSEGASEVSGVNRHDDGNVSFQEVRSRRSRKRHVNQSQNLPLESTQNEGDPVTVIIRATEVNLANANPIIIAKHLNETAKGYIKKIRKVREGGLAITCKSAGQAKKLKAINHLGKWAVTTEFPRSELECKGVISGVPLVVTEEEVVEVGKDIGILSAKRLTRKKDGKMEKTLSVCLTFSGSVMPREVCLGYEVFPVRVFVPSVLRCYKCQRFGHIASVCKGGERCVRCGEEHAFEKCSKKDNPRCLRCGGAHSAAYAGCEKMKQQKQIQYEKVTKNISYAEAAKVVQQKAKIDNYKDRQTWYTHEKTTQRKQNKGDKRVDRSVEHTVTMCSVETQTDKQDIGMQTQEKEEKIQSGTELAQIMVGVIQICCNDKYKNKKEAETLMNALFKKVLGKSLFELSGQKVGDKIPNKPHRTKTTKSGVSGKKTEMGPPLSPAPKKDTSSRKESSEIDTS